MILATKSKNQHTWKRSQLAMEIRHGPDKPPFLCGFQLCYSGKGCARIPETLGKLFGPQVQSLDLSYNELVTLKGLEAFLNLRELILDNNQLGDSLSMPFCAKLHTLSLNKNQIRSLEGLLLQIKEQLPCLSYLSLLGNQACANQLSNPELDDEDYQRYRCFVLHHLPHLKFLDSSRVTEQERLEAKSRGQFMKIVTPSTTGNLDVNVHLNNLAISGKLKYSPLPKALRDPDDYKGAYGKCRYRYSGKHSEGNRFISNKDL